MSSLSSGPWGVTESNHTRRSTMSPSGKKASRKVRCEVPSTASTASGWVRPKDHLLQKMFLRESFGTVRSRRRPANHEATAKLFTRLPARLAFCLKDAVPPSAIEAGHVFMGFTACGQFLLSYTQTADDLDLEGGGGELDLLRHDYRLHWWLFLPYRRAKKVAEAMLFSDDGGVFGNLHLSFCQWPGDATRLVVYACALPDLPSSSSSSRPCYLTVTAAPSLDACRECARVAASYEEEDVAEAWNSCARLSCLKHGLTIHTSFDVVSPYPAFEPKISLKRVGHVIVNTGNLIHSLHIQLEKLPGNNGEETTNVMPPPAIATTSSDSFSSPKHRWSELHVGTSELTLYGGGEVFSPPMCSPGSSAAHCSDSETTDCESEYGGTNGMARQNEEKMKKVAEFVEELSPNMSKKHSKRTTTTSSTFFHHRQSGNDGVHEGRQQQQLKRTLADKAYELTDDDFDDGVREKLSTFRKKRLAEKTYEFTDDDSENVTPPPRLLRSRAPEAPAAAVAATTTVTTESAAETTEQSFPARSPRPHDAEEQHVLRPLDCNQVDEVSGLLVDTMPVPELLSPGGMVKKDTCSGGGSASSLASPRPYQQQQQVQQQRPRFHAKFTRRFIETDGEVVSVITDVEEDDAAAIAAPAAGGGYHTVLPLSVHGSGYQPMAMVSNAKAERQLSGRMCAKVTQHTFDLEVFCHHMAHRLCRAAGKKYWFCNDYDVELVDLDPESGDALFVAVVLVNATVFTTTTTQKRRRRSAAAATTISSLHRMQYQAAFTFTWNVDNGTCALLDSEPLTEVSSAFTGPPGVWHPAKSASLALQRTFGVTNSTGIRCFSNDAVIKGTSLKTIVDSEHLVAIIQDELP